MSKDDLYKILHGFEEAVHTIRTWHGMGLSEKDEKSMWDTYNEYSPEMKHINAIIAFVKHHLEKL